MRRVGTTKTTKTTASALSVYSMEEEFVDFAGVLEGVSRTWTARSGVSRAHQRKRTLKSGTSPTVEVEEEDAPKKTSCLSALPWYLWPLLITIDTIGPFSTDAYLPNILQIQEQFHTSTMMVALTLQLNWVVTAVASTAVGVLADKYGRRLVLMACFAIYVAATVLAAISQSIYVLIVARLLMALGQSSSVMAQVIARDLIDDATARLRVMAALGSLQPIVVVAAPIIGGVIGNSVGWRWVFWIQAAWGALAFLGSMAMREPKGAAASESEAEDTQDSGSASLCGTARRLLTSRMYMGAVGLFGIMFAGISAMLTLLPFVLQQYCGLGEGATGGLMGAVPPFIMTGGMLSMLLSKYLPPVNILRLAMLPFLLATALAVLLALYSDRLVSVGIPLTAWWPLLLPCFLMTAMNGVFTPVCQTLYLNAFQDIAGAAAGASGFVQTLMMAAGSALASAAWDGTPRSFYATLAALMLVAQLWFWLTLGLCPPPEAEDDEQEEKDEEEKAPGGNTDRSARSRATDAGDLEIGRRIEA